MREGAFRPLGGASSDCAVEDPRQGVNSLVPDIEKVPISKMRISQTSTATNTGTTESSCSRLRISLPRPGWAISASDTPHQVSTAFMVAARNHAPSRYQTSAGSLRFSALIESSDARWPGPPAPGVNSRAMPAKSMPQKATARMKAQRSPANRRSPSRLVRAKSVVLKLNSSNMSSAITISAPNAISRFILNPSHRRHRT